MDEAFIRDRITELRLKKQVSEYKMSLDIGRSKGYIQSISSGRSLPSLSEFLYICEYLQISPKDFFDTETQEPAMLHQLTESARHLSDQDISLLLSIAERLKWPKTASA